MRRTDTFVCLVLLVFTLVGAAAAVELTGSVAQVNLDEVTIEVVGELLPREGDSIRISTPVEGIGPVALKGTWKVSRVARDGVLAIPDVSEGAKPSVGDVVRIDSPAPQGRHEVAANLHSAAEAWGTAAANAKRSTTQRPVELVDPEAITENLETAFEAYAVCDYDVALRQLGQSEAIRPGDQRTGLLRSLIDKQMQAESLYQAALTQRSVDLARQSVLVASPDSASPPCQMGKQRELLVRLRGREISNLADEAKRKGFERYQAQQENFEAIAEQMVGILGDYKRYESGEVSSMEALDSSVQKIGEALAAAGASGCVVQEHGSDTGEAFLVQAPEVAGVDTYHVWSVDQPRASEGDEQACTSARECLEKMLPNPAMQILQVFSSVQQAMAAAQQRCGQ